MRRFQWLEEVLASLAFLVATSGLAAGAPPGAVFGEDILIGVRRLSERVLVLTDVPSTCQVTALATGKGIVVVDTGISHGFGAAFRATIERELGRGDFAFVIDTHAHRDHTFGNQAFSDAVIIGHESCRRALQQLHDDWKGKAAEYVSLHRARAGELSQQLEASDPESAEARQLRLRMAVNNRIAEDVGGGQSIVLPRVSFSDRLTLDAGDMELRLRFVGEGHTDGDILVHIPEEGLLITGDVFHPGSVATSMLGDRVDVQRILDVLGSVLGGEARIGQVVCGHEAIMTGVDLAIRREYMQALWSGLVDAHARGLDLESAGHSLSLERFSALMRSMKLDRPNLERQHDRVLATYWQQLSRLDSHTALR